MAKALSYSNDEVRQMILQYFYNRNKHASSRKGKKGSHVKIGDIKSDLKELYGFKGNEIIGHINYLKSQGWLEIEVEKKSFTTDKGVTLPNDKEWYSITSQGIDKIDGPGSFTHNRFAGIKIEATGQNIITLGDGNQVNVRYQDAGQALSELRKAVKNTTDLPEDIKLEIVSDIDTISSQLSKPVPNKHVIKALWEGVTKAASVASLVKLVAKASPFITALFNG